MNLNQFKEISEKYKRSGEDLSTLSYRKRKAQNQLTEFVGNLERILLET